jgi:hypothetical protein
VVAVAAGRFDVEVRGRSRVHVRALAGRFLQSVAYGMPLTIAGLLTSSTRERWFRKVELWIDGTGAVQERAPAVAPRRRRQLALGRKAKALKPCSAFPLAKPTST